MPILQDSDREAVSKRFDVELKQNVNLKLFTMSNVGGLYIPGRECKTCAPTQQLLEELVELSPKLSLEVTDFYKNADDAKAMGVDKIPAIVINGENVGGDDNIKFYGLPSGIEFAVLLESIIDVSHKNSTLQLETRRHLKSLKEDVHIQVFVTPT